MEGTWLLTVALVPAVFASEDFLVFVDLPKTVLLRSLTGLLAALWTVEWALRDASAGSDRDASTWHRFHAWTRESPARWAVVAGLAFLTSNVTSTLLSQAPSLSIWGNNPGRDGYGLYNTVSLFVLFLCGGAGSGLGLRPGV